MQPQTRRRLDGLLALGAHPLDAQLTALAEYAHRTGHVLDVIWTLLPGEDPSIDAPDSDFALVVYDDEIAGFTPAERDGSGPADAPCAGAMDWHVAHPTPRRKTPTTHLPVYGCACIGETGADAVLCVGNGSLDRQIAQIEAFALRTAYRLQGVYVATCPENLTVLLRDFSASNRALGTGPALTVWAEGQVLVHR